MGSLFRKFRLKWRASARLRSVLRISDRNNEATLFLQPKVSLELAGGLGDGEHVHKVGLPFVA
jgi:hypothetical protein